MALIVGATSAPPALAAPPAFLTRSDALYRHPLLSEQGFAAIDSLRAEGVEDADEILAQLTWGDAFEVAEDGTVLEDRSFVQRTPATTDPDAKPVAEPEPGPVWVSPAWADAAARAEGGRIDALIALRGDDIRTSAPTLMRAIERGIVEGTVLREVDVYLTREAFLLERAEEGADVIDMFLPTLEVCGATLLWRHDSAMIVAASIPTDCLAALTASADVASVTPVGEGEEDAGLNVTIPGDEIDGGELEDLLQTTPFYAEGYSGSANLGYTEDDAIELLNENLGYYDSIGIYRMHAMECIFGLPCWFSPSFNPGDGHATGAVSIMAGDLTAGQDASITGLPRRPRCPSQRGSTSPSPMPS